MSSSIINEHTAWNVSNMMFERVLGFARDLAKGAAVTDRERDWVQDFARKVSGFGTYSPDVTVEELFADPDQVEFWRSVLGDLAQRIFRREIGNQADQSWQVATIWACAGLGPRPGFFIAADASERPGRIVSRRGRQ